MPPIWTICWIRLHIKTILNLKLSLIFRKLIPASVWGLLILIVVGFPGTYIPEAIGFWEWLSYDKVIHILIFAPLTFLILNGFKQQYFDSKRRYLYILIAVGFSLAYGLLTEVLQVYVFVGRHGNVYDFIANSIGAFAGWQGFVTIYRKKIKEYANIKQD